ncbi:hypothetical protein [Benzoatithermus flavus]|uniref:CopG family transcriptional regulator n=1 Tax=Benzoatithermus flavus TaxID=3108223 RepID=A0ABU8XUW0_9PROT
MNAYKLPDRVTIRLTMEDRDILAKLAKDMLDRGRIFVNATDVLKQALKVAHGQLEAGTKGNLG